jgi:hypothetical protein
LGQTATRQKKPRSLDETRNWINNRSRQINQLDSKSIPFGEGDYPVEIPWK